MSDIISDGGMDPRYEYEKARRTDKDKRIAELEAEHRDCLQTITDMQSKWEEVKAENERLRKNCDASRDYSISLQRVIEYHCTKKTIPERIFRECPHHAAMLVQHAAMEGE